ANCIERVLTDQVLADELTRNARDLIEQNYSWAAIATATARVYSTSIDARQR
ncbi:MAG: glycosyltransferase involved in cell wall biosynthesis, partial [Ilumatobacter sp.]